MGLGLIGIGRPWPSDEREVPTEGRVNTLLHSAIEQGIRFFDTAPAYGSSENRLGDFLSRLPLDVRQSLSIATKCGEQWSPERGSQVDHSLAALEDSLALSLLRLHDIDILQLHKCTANVLRNDETLSWIRSVRENGHAKKIGASVSTVDDLVLALDTDLFDYLQFPSNARFPQLTQALKNQESRVTPILNRPMASGMLAAHVNPFLFHADNFATGIVLSGTTSVDHLRSNIGLFNEATSHERP